MSRKPTPRPRRAHAVPKLAAGAVSEFVQPLVGTSSPVLPRDPRAWTRGVAGLRRCGLLGRLALRLTEEDTEALPAAVRNALQAARAVAETNRRTLLWECERIAAALDGLHERVVLLKGAAYAVAGLAPGSGRLASDVDVLVPRETLAATEAALLAAGWRSVKRDRYDQRYYRRWMHELPPLRHGLRGTFVDVHHSILPLTARRRPDAALLLASAVPIGATRFATLAPADMVLHSASHLFSDGEIRLGLRDLIDIHELLQSFGAVEGFWEGLVPRARRLDLERPLYYALRYCAAFLGSAVPAEVWSAAQAGDPGASTRALMDALVARVLAPTPHASAPLDVAVARWLLYVRSHYLRMPLRLLLPHLVRKALVRHAPVQDGRSREDSPHE